MNYCSQKEYLKLAIPFILSTMTQPLLGAVDTAVVGRLDSPTFIGGVAVGTVIFNTLYWLLGFLRVATSGFTAQTLANNRDDEVALAWLRPGVIAAAVGLLFVLIQSLVIDGAMAVYQVDPDIAVHVKSYFDILIWGAPFVLIGYVNLGWLMGRGLVREVLFLQIGINCLNIILDIIFVHSLHMGVEGVAYATLISQALGFILGAFLIFRRLPVTQLRKYLSGVFEAKAIARMAAMNRDLFIRTICLLTMTNIFVATGSSMGTDILAANAILFQIQYLIAYLFDGHANAVSVIGGRSVGNKDLESLNRLRGIAHLHMSIKSLIVILCLTIFQDEILYLFTDIENVLTVCNEYFFYLIAFVIAMAPGLVYAGFFIGATCSAPIRNAMVYALIGFLALKFTLVPQLGNHGLWITFTVFCIIRSLTLVFAWKQILGQHFSSLRSAL
ncbi:MATE family efflux transporter [Vibrio sp. JC009]|uniref:MATE family efflux transporter n=1 Tax=Vibrio sp. JC009 TaxID=2912314 RepID=UPI0023AF96DC|nr:MATE family efflux transporter [Vibrio sp. JC009]WED23454.1 MATE family efflux transporter [Vibrio sp. JC009]